VKPDEIRQRILQDHEVIRGLLVDVEANAAKASQGDADATDALRDRGLKLSNFLFEHLSLEDAYLAPILLQCRGEQAARHLSEEHREQRLLFAFLVGRLLDASRPAVLLVRELQTFVSLMRDDMRHEEEAFLESPELWN
jgi:hypothetical protein